jgi:predicted PurR-regulated permease PerM
MKKKGQSVEKIIEAFVGIILLLIFVPVIFSMLSSLSPENKEVIIQNNTAIEQAKNLSEQLTICQNNLNELNATIITKEDLNDLYNAVSQINKNVITIYETNQNYIQNYFSLTIMLSITLTLVFSIGLLTLIDLTIFKAAFIRSFTKIIRQRFTKIETEVKT